MTRRIDTTSRPHDSRNTIYQRPPANLLPANLNAALAIRDDMGGRATDARRRASDLLDDAAEVKATQADQEATAAALLAGKPLPAPVNAQKLADDRANIVREVDGYATAISNQDNEIDNLKEALTTAPGFGDETAALRDTINTLGAELATAFTNFTNREALDGWLRNRAQYAPTTDISNLDAQPLAQRPELTNGQVFQPGTDAIRNLIHALTA